MNVPSTKDPPLLAIIGAGRVGRSLAAAAAKRGIAARLLGRERPAAALAGVPIVLICTPDAQIEAVGAQLHGQIDSSAIVGHASGATPISALAATGAAAFGLHPLQTIPAGETDIDGIACAVSATSAEVARRVFELGERLGMKPFLIAEEDRAAYHAAATIASNFLFALEESAAELLAAAGAEHPRAKLAPLVLASATNWQAGGAAALTGPIARGDEVTIERHLAAIRDRAPRLLPLYEALAERTRAVAESAGAPA